MIPKLKLESIYNGQRSEIVTLPEGFVTLGREPENSVVIDSTAVSRRHAIITSAGSHWLFRDLGSTNGSFVNDKPVIGGRFRILNQGDVIKIANFQICVSLIYEEELETINEPSLLLLYRDEFQQEIFLDAGDVFAVGGPDSSISIDGEDPNREQFVIFWKTGHFQLTINETRNHVVVNGTSARGQITLSHGDEITAGLHRLVVNDPVITEMPPVAVVEEKIVEAAPEKTPELKRPSYVDQILPAFTEGPTKDTGWDKPKAAKPAPSTTDENPWGTEDEAKPYQEVKAYRHSELPAHLKKAEDEKEWQSEPAKRKQFVGKQVMFAPEEDETTGTLSMGRQHFMNAAGMSMSQRAKSFSYIEESKKAIPDKVWAIIGGITFIFLIIVIIFLMFGE